MSEILKRSAYSVLASAFTFAVLASGASAQGAPAQPSTAQPATTQPAAARPAAPATQAAMCSAKATPAEVATGQNAVKLTFALSSPIGAVSGVEAPQGSGIAVAAVGDIPREGLANPTDQARPIALAAETNTLTLWIKTAGVKAGEFDLKLQGANGTCSGKLTVK